MSDNVMIRHYNDSVKWYPQQSRGATVSLSHSARPPENRIGLGDFLAENTISHASFQLNTVSIA
jgi:hypothetical protein